MNNSGGAIFRFVGTTASLPHDTRERYFCANPKLDLQKIADAFGFGQRYLTDAIQRSMEGMK